MIQIQQQHKTYENGHSLNNSFFKNLELREFSWHADGLPTGIQGSFLLKSVERQAQGH